MTERAHLVSRHHGVHLGTMRDGRSHTVQVRRAAVHNRVDKAKAVWCLDAMSTPEFASMFRVIQRIDEQATWEINEWIKFCHQIAGK